jgi:transposase-like protein
MEFMGAFPDDDACLNYLWRTRYSSDGEHALCPHCEVERTFRHYEGKQQRQAWTCVACGHYLYPTAGTIFHKSSTSLHLWFFAMYIMSSTRCGISAKQLERELGVTYKTAWRMFTLIRNELMVQDDETPLTGVVEMDEMYVGRRVRQSDRAGWAHATEKWERRQAAQKWSLEHKTQVFGAVERNRKQWIDGEPRPTVTRHGRVAAYVVPSRRKPTLMGHVARRVDPDAVVYTDTAHAYGSVPAKRHETINHGDRIYVRGDVHTQTIEGFWSLVKRGISGTHHAVSPKWLQGYLNEYVWRYNHRDDPKAMFLLLLLRAANPPA